MNRLTALLPRAAGFLFVVWATLISHSAMAEDLSSAQHIIQQTASQLQSTLQRPEYKSDFRKATEFVDQILDSHIDFDRVSMLVLGKYWKDASAEQRDQFKGQFKLLLVRTYTTAFTEYSDWTINYLPDQAGSSADKTIVRTEILQEAAQPISVNYRMLQESNGEWKVYDVMIEGVSLLQNYRTSFTNQIAQTGSIDKLISDLAKRNASAMSADSTGKKPG